MSRYKSLPYPYEMPTNTWRSESLDIVTGSTSNRHLAERVGLLTISTSNKTCFDLNRASVLDSASPFLQVVTPIENRKTFH